ncbi:class II aldolase/adducin family protein [Enterovirga sp.]|uniref:class II aldolase/adducin family protein n=1 Tax=Enterovirga sp. TaxID=2026350 RepID=UPI00262A9E2D|nr:class II aldolase/adducin family protein [Enterovirga sp.]MDB5589997.1 class aldolase [Enterovirga sp.]
MSAANEDETRAAIVKAMLDLERLGLTQGTAGNVSVRHGEGCLITPSGIPADELRAEEIVRLRHDGTHEGTCRPSSEWRFHRDIYLARPEVGAVVHAHPTYATAFAICGRDIPAVHYMIAAAGGPTVRCASYATFGTEELSRAALVALEGRTCCLLAHHGTIATGPTLKKAMWVAVELETLCRQYAIALQVGAPGILPDDEISRVMERFGSYGPRPPAA